MLKQNVNQIEKKHRKTVEHDWLEMHSAMKNPSYTNNWHCVLAVKSNESLKTKLMFLFTFEQFLLHLSNLHYNLIFLANRWSTWTKISTQAANCHPVKF